MRRLLKWVRNRRKPQDLQINKSENVKVYSDLGYQHYRRKPTGGKEVLGQGKVGTELHHDTQTYQYRRRQFNFTDPEADNSYEEEINNPALGFYKKVSEKLSSHKNHGSAKKKKGNQSK